MFHLLLAIIYLAFFSLGLPDSLLGDGMAHHVSGIWSACFLCGNHIHDYRSSSDFQSALLEGKKYRK